MGIKTCKGPDTHLQTYGPTSAHHVPANALNRNECQIHLCELDPLRYTDMYLALLI